MLLDTVASGLMPIRLEPRCSFIVTIWAPKHMFALHGTCVVAMGVGGSLIERGNSFQQDGDISWRRVIADVTASLKLAKLTPANSRHYGGRGRGKHTPKRGS